ncbi:hypothetical protein SAMN04487776_12420 [Priestia megaterium]|nr:hypothetical protein SAMN04487776_12420 [Priestia megaterium]
MSDYYKKIIKDSSDEYKGKRKYENDKEEYELKKHDDKCEKCHAHKCDKCHDDHEKEKGIFTDFDVSENTSISFPPTTGTTGTNPQLNTRAQVSVDVDDKCDGVLLQGTVEWTPNSISVLAEIIAALLDLTIPLGVEGTFRIWRSCDNGPFVPIFQTKDTSIISDISIVTFAIDFSTVTTSFHWVDKNPCCGDNRYYLTLDVALTSDPMIPEGGGIIGGLLSTLIPPITVTTGTVVFTAAEVENVG